MGVRRPARLSRRAAVCRRAIRGRRSLVLIGLEFIPGPSPCACSDLSPQCLPSGDQEQGPETVKVRVEKQIGEFSLVFETGELAKQATAAVVARYGDTTVLNAVTSAPSERAQDFFPLTCDYRERTAAAGKFPGGFIKREGRPSMKDTLTSRLIDRPIRPLFPEGLRQEVQCQCIVFASDRQHDSDVVAMNGVAAALFISPLPISMPEKTTGTPGATPSALAAASCRWKVSSKKPRACKR